MVVLHKNAKIHFTDLGKGQVIVLLHGYLENCNMWKYLSPVLTKKYRVIAIDLLGHGQTESIGYIHTMEDMADAVFNVLKALKIEKATFIGHSMGGYVALAFAEHFSKMISGLILMNSTSYADSEERKMNRDRAIKAVKQNYEMAVRMSISNLFYEENREKLIDEIEWVKNEALNTPLQGIIAALEGMKVRKERTFLLHQNEFPICLILGKKDPVLIYDEHKIQAEKSTVKLVSFNDGHMSHLENKYELEKTITEFMALL